ncbi:MAG: hypothetical protein R3E90_02525 [Marinicella sp.]
MPTRYYRLVPAMDKCQMVYNPLVRNKVCYTSFACLRIIRNWRKKFEAELMHKGMISPPTYEKLREQTGVLVNHANYMTYLDWWR